MFLNLPEIFFFRTHTKSLMFATVILGDEGFYSSVEFWHGFVATDVDIIVFDGTPEAFHHHNVLMLGHARPC